MNQRTKWLVLGATTVFGLYSLDQLYQNYIEKPTSNLTAELAGLQKKQQTHQDNQAIARSHTKRLETYQQRSLPYDPQLARSAYQDWLLTLVEKHTIESAAVDAAQPKPIEVRSRVDRRKRIKVGHSIAYTLRGQSTLARWSEWLQEFNRAGHLHKIESLSLNPLGSKGILDATLTIEVLSLTTAVHKSDLSDWQNTDSEAEITDDYQQLVRRNLFAKGFAKSLFQIELKAITSNRQGQSQAWFSLDEQGNTEAIQCDQQLPIQLHEITVIEILSNKVLIKFNGDSYWMALGQTVGEICETKN